MNEQEFAQRLRQYRKDKGLTQQELADQLGVSNKTVSRWESGSYPDVTTLVALARALAVNPDLLLMDEPYGQMDIKLRFYLEDEVVRLWKETGSTVLFITHNIEEAVYLAERILILSNKPTTIKEDFKVDLPRPRDVTSPEFTKIRQYVTDQIKWW